MRSDGRIAFPQDSPEWREQSQRLRAEDLRVIQQGERVQTIAVPTALVAFNWAPQTNRYQRVARFVDVLFSRIDRLQGAGFDAKWKSINLAATVPGLERFPAAQEWLDRQTSAPRALR